jgi:hypothetical protein
MMPAKKKPDLALVIGGIADKKKGSPMEPEHEEEDPEHDAMSELGDALAAKDMKRAMSAFRVLHDLCASGGGDDDDHVPVDEE